MSVYSKSLLHLCRTMGNATSPQNQLVMRKIDSNFLWHSTSHPKSMFLEWLQGAELWFPKHSPLMMALPQLELRTLALISFVRPKAMPLHLKTNRDEEYTFKSFIVFNIAICRPIFRAVIGSQIVVRPTTLQANPTHQTNNISHFFKSFSFVLPHIS